MDDEQFESLFGEKAKAIADAKTDDIFLGEETDFPLSQHLYPYARGATWGYGDEAIQAVSTAAGNIAGEDGKQIGKDTRELINKNAALYARENPIKDAVGDVVGGFATARGGGATGWPAFFKNVAEGGITGFGYGDTLYDKFVGAGQGAAGAAVAHPILASMGKLWNRARNPSQKQFAKLMGRDYVTLDDIAGGLTGGGMPLDIGPNFLGKTEALFAMPGKARTMIGDALTERQLTVNQEIKNEMRDRAGVNFDFYATAEELAKNRRNTARRRYGDLDNQAYYPSEEVLAQTKFGVNKGEWDKAVKRYEKKVRRDFDPETDIYSASLWDLFQRELRSTQDSSFSKFSPKPEAGYAAKETRKIVLDNMDKTVPGFAETRNIYSDDIGMERALELGRKSINKPYDQVQAELKQMGQGEREMFINGFGRAIADRMDASPDTANQARNMVKSPKLRQRIRTLFGGNDDAADVFLEHMERKANQGVSYATVTGNSATASRQQFIEDVAPNSLWDAAGKVVTGDVKGAATDLANEAKDMAIARFRRKMSEGDAEELGQMLIAKSMDELQGLIGRTGKLANMDPAQQGSISGLLGLLNNQDPLNEDSSYRAPDMFSNDFY